MKLKKSLLFVGIAALIVISAGILLANNTAGQYDEFAQCLTQKGVVMYGTDWCSHCQNQKDMFGRSFDEVAYVNCDYQRQVCNENGVSGYPTWRINGENYPGEQSFERLSELSGCSL